MKKPNYEKCNKCGSEIFKQIITDLVYLRTDKEITVCDRVDDDAINTDIICAKCGRNGFTKEVNEMEVECIRCGQKEFSPVKMPKNWLCDACCEALAVEAEVNKWHDDKIEEELGAEP